MVVGMDGNASEEEHVPNRPQLNKAQFIEQVAKSLDGDRKRAAAALDAVIKNVYDAIRRGERVAISGFGVFERRERAARMGRNPATGESVQIPASRVPAFRPGEKFKEAARGETGAAGGAKSTAKKSAAKKSAAKKSSPAKKSTAKKAAATKSTAKKSSPAKKSTAKKSAKKAPAKKR